MNRKHILSDLKVSANRVGKLYPILLDKQGNVLDGSHRLKVDPNWPKMKLDHIDTEEKRLIVKLVGNVCRRSVSSREKSEIVGRLAQIYSSTGIKSGQMPYEIAQKTGMSYRWVMTYLPNRMKMFPGRGGPSKNHKKAQYQKVSAKFGVANPATLFRVFSHRTTSPILSVVNYKNTKFVNILLDKTIYSKIETASNNLGIEPEKIIGNALLSALKALTAYGNVNDDPKEAKPTLIIH